MRNPPSLRMTFICQADKKNKSNIVLQQQQNKHTLVCGERSLCVFKRPTARRVSEPRRHQMDCLGRLRQTSGLDPGTNYWDENDLLKQRGIISEMHLFSKYIMGFYPLAYL